jgi:transcriptional regulator with XRE-family HTH domain
MDMDMKTNARRLKQLREAKSWSQEHLAEASGLSLRTVQRVETEGNASPETRLALAGALGVDVAELGAAPVPSPPEPSPNESRSGSGKNRFLRHCIVYIVVCSWLAWMDWHQNGRLVWAYWPFFGWGIGVFFHGLGLWLPSDRR